MMEAFLAVLLDPTTGLRTVAALLVAKVVLASIAAAKAREFNWRWLPEFVVDDVLPYGGGLLVLLALSYFDPMLKPVYVAASGAVSAMLLRQIWDHVKVLFGADPYDGQ